MSRTLFLHVGLQKTGTTTIQTCLTENRLLLAENGFVYPDPSSVRIGLDGRSHGHLSLSLTGYWRETPYQLSKEEAWGELRNLYFESEGHLLISHEGLSTPQIIPHLPFIGQMLRGIDVKVIIYLRRQDVFAQSVYKERLKANGKNDFQTSFEKGDYRQLLDFYSIVRAWGKCVGKANIIIRLFEKAQLFKGDALEDFLSITSIDKIPGLQRPSEYSNPTMSRTVLEISRALNSLDIMGADVTALKLWLNDVLMQGQAKTTTENSLISPENQLDILNEFMRGNEAIARQYLGRADGRLFYDAPPKPGENWMPYVGIPPEDVARILAALFDKYSILNSSNE